VSAAANLSAQIRRAVTLDEPIRFALYSYVRDQAPSDVGREEAAKAIGLTRKVAAFHLDRLVDAGLLDTTYRRLSGRRGPGAGRPAKLYRQAQVEVAVSLPQRSYDLAARIFARALGLKAAQSSTRVLRKAAREFGFAAGAGARAQERDLLDVLSEQGFEPVQRGDLIRIRNCPFHSLAQDYKLPICEMNFAFHKGILAGLENDVVRPRLTPEDGYCCVTFSAQRATPHGDRGAGSGQGH
jgi:predicted ArsR family transcriptional regulator